MARPEKQGLDYFSLDVDMCENDKVSILEAKFGNDGFTILIKIFMKIYKNGYYYNWTLREQLLFAKRINVDINKVNDVINSCVSEKIFSSQMLEKHGILTSKNIQIRFIEATKRRKNVEMFLEYLLIDKKTVNENINLVNVYINSDYCIHDDDIMTTKTSKNVTFSTQSKVKESKVIKKSISDEIPKKDLQILDADLRFIPFTEIVNLFNSICTSLSQVQQLSDARKRRLTQIWEHDAKHSLDFFRKLFEKTNVSEFLKGNNDKGWKANFDFVINKNNMLKILEGNYESSTNIKTIANFKQRKSVDDSEFYANLN